MKLRLIRFGLLVAVVCALAGLTGSSAKATPCFEYYGQYCALGVSALPTGMQNQIAAFYSADFASGGPTTLLCAQLNALATEINAETGTTIDPLTAAAALAGINTLETTYCS